MKKNNILKIMTISLILFLDTTHGGETVCKGIGGDSGGPKGTWPNILKCKRLYPDFPEINIEGYEISYNKLCKINEKIRTIDKILINENDSHIGDRYDYVSTDQIQERRECVKYDTQGNCLQYITVKYEIPLMLEINVYLIRYDSSMDLFFSKDFELKECGKE